MVKCPLCGFKNYGKNPQKCEKCDIIFSYENRYGRPTDYCHEDNDVIIITEKKK